MATPCGADDILRRRALVVAPVLSIAYKSDPIVAIKGERQYIVESSGRTLLDLVNNVAHVGHCHPTVVKAAAEQLAQLNTNSRLLSPGLVTYAERLVELFPPSLNTVFFVNSGTEANDLALRLARTHTGHRDVVVLDEAYHGHSPSMIDISPYKLRQGRLPTPDHVHIVPTPDVYKGKYIGDDACARYVEEVEKICDKMRMVGRSCAAFFAESLMGPAGQIPLPTHFLRQAVATIRNHGGVYIADEVQVGFGRMGKSMWGFEIYPDVTPDIVTMAKGVGNGYPLGCVITTRAIAESFMTGMEYFNTTGGSNVAMAVGCAVLDVIRDEKLMENALVMGNMFYDGLAILQKKHCSIIGDVRGCGLFIGVELVTDGDRQRPATDVCSTVQMRMRKEGILIGVDGPDNNVLKIKPPLCINKRDVHRVLGVLDMLLEEFRHASNNNNHNNNNNINSSLGKFCPSWSCDDVKIASKLFHILDIVTSRQVDSYIDQNFYIKDSLQNSYVFKIANSMLSVEDIDLENAVMIFLEHSGLTPKIISSCCRSNTLMLKFNSGHCLKNELPLFGPATTGFNFVRIASWLEGDLLSSFELTSSLQKQLGAFIGSLVFSLRTFSHPRAFRRFDWDVIHAKDMVYSLIDCVDNPDKRTLLLSVTNKMVARLDRVLPFLRFSICHNDANDCNILVTKHDDKYDFAIVDFGDVIWTATVCELAIACAYCALSKSNPLLIIGNILTGFVSNFHLISEEINALWPLVVLRICLSVAMSSRAIKRDPDNEYLKISASPGWAFLQNEARVDPDAADTFFYQCV